MRERGVLGVFSAAVFLVASCGGNAPTPGAEQVDLAAMDEYGCGYGFWLGSPDQEVAVQLAADNERGLPQLWLTSNVGRRPAGRMSHAEALPARVQA